MTLKEFVIEIAIRIRPKKRLKGKLICAVCDGPVKARPGDIKIRQRRNEGGLLYCSRKCLYVKQRKNWKGKTS